jgi:hypothetical protein
MNIYLVSLQIKMNMKKLNLHNGFQNEFHIQFQIGSTYSSKIDSFYFCFSFHFYNLQMNSINYNDNLIINYIAKKNYYEYGKFDEKLFIIDMKRIFVFTHDAYLF